MKPKTAIKREPPKGSRFTSDNQPKNRGRKKKSSLDDILQDLLETPDSKGETELEKILKAHIKVAKSGGIKSAELILERYYGKPVQSIATTIQSETPTPQVVLYLPVKEGETIGEKQ